MIYLKVIVPLVLLMFGLNAISRANTEQVLPNSSSSDKGAVQDARLGRSVTVRHPQVQVGELLEIFSKQTGVTLVAGDEVTAGQPVVVYLKDLPLKDAMEAVRSLFSYQDAPAEWVHTKDETGAFIYRLSSKVRKILTRWPAQIQEDYEQQAQDQMRLARLSDKELKALTATNENAARLGDSRFQDARLGWSFLGNLFSSEQLRQVLRGDLALKNVPVSELPPSYKPFEQALTQTRPPVFAHFQPYTLMTVETVLMEQDISPWLKVSLGNEKGKEFHGYAGGYHIEMKWFRKIASEWVEPGATLQSALDDKAITEPKPEKTGEKPLDFSPHDDLRKLAEAVPCSLIALRLPEGNTSSPFPTPYGRTLGEYLKSFTGLTGGVPGAMYKWSRDGVLLFNYPTWFRNMDKMPSWKVVKRLRQHEEENQGFLTTAHIIEAARRSTADQLRMLGRLEFPCFEHVAPVKDLLLTAVSPVQGRLTGNTKTSLQLPLAASRLSLLPQQAREFLTTSPTRSAAWLHVNAVPDMMQLPPEEQEPATFSSLNGSVYRITSANDLLKLKTRSVWFFVRRDDGKSDYLGGWTYPDYQSRRVRGVPLPGSPSATEQTTAGAK